MALSGVHLTVISFLMVKWNGNRAAALPKRWKRKASRALL
jgi:hypothetical protein